MNLSTPCPHCQRPISIRQFVTNTALTFRCRACGTTLHYQPWVWAVTLFMVVALIVVLAGIGFENILAERAARAAMRWVFLTFVVLSLVVSTLVFLIGPFRATQRT